MEIGKETKQLLLWAYKQKRILLEGNILKLITDDGTDKEFSEYLSIAINKDKEFRKRRLEFTKEVQNQNKELVQSQEQNMTLMEELKIALSNAEKAKDEAEKIKDSALNDLDVLQKKSQFELISVIVKVALMIIVGVGITTTIMYFTSMIMGKDTAVIASTWANIFGILLTNAFSIVGTLMGVKYASEKKTET